MAVNGAVVRTPGVTADPARDRITVDGRPVPPPEVHRYVVVHKPRGYVCTRRDPQGRPVVTELVPARARLFPVGRLDVDAEGVLLLTNDGPLTHRLLHPRYGLPRVYEVEVAGTVRPGDLARWRAGVELADGPAVPAAVALRRSGRRTSRLRVVFTEGRKREVKRYCEALGHPVRRLRRVAFGPVTLGNLAPGQWRELTRAELAALRRAVAREPEPGRRGVACRSVERGL